MHNNYTQKSTSPHLMIYPYPGDLRVLTLEVLGPKLLDFWRTHSLGKYTTSHSLILSNWSEKRKIIENNRLESSLNNINDFYFYYMYIYFI